MEFTTNWFVNQRQNFERHLLPLRGNPLRCLEIGSFEGRSALWMVRNVLHHPDSHLTCIDPHSYESVKAEHLSATHINEGKATEARERFLKNTQELRDGGRLTYLQQPSAVALRQLTGGFDFAYIDGSHYGSDVLTDAVLCWLLLKKHGIMAFDDYTWGPPKSVHPSLVPLARPKHAIDVFQRLWKGQFTRLRSRRNQVWIRRSVPNAMLLDDVQ